MVEFTMKDADELQKLVDDAIAFANMGSRTAYKALLAIKPRLDANLDKWAKSAKEGKGPAK